MPNLSKLDQENLSENIPKFKQWISEESWGHWQQFLEHDLKIMTTVTPSYTNSGWHLDVLKAASARQVRADKGYSGSNNGTALEEMLSEEQLPTMVCVLASYS